jgi:hypothetical protein
MSKYMTNINAGQLLGELQNAGMIEPSAFTELGQFIQAQKQKKELPLYLRILVGIGAFIASLCFIGFLSISGIINFNSEASLIFCGLIFVCGALFLAKTSEDKDNTVKHSFLMQSSFYAMAVGKILFVIGFVVMFDSNSGWGVTLSTFIITAATYHVYHMSIDRFLSTLAIFISLHINIVSERYFGTSIEIVLNLFFFIQVILAAVLLTHCRVKRDYIPLTYATVFSLCITVIFFAMESKIGHLINQQPYNLTFVNAILTISLIGLIGWAAGNMEKLKTEPLMWASLGSVLLGIISAPSVILSICLMVLGYAKHEKLLLIIGVLLVPIFIFIYYYNLDINLMAKSVVLVGSGIILLAGRCYLAAKKLDREAV